MSALSAIEAAASLWGTEPAAPPSALPGISPSRGEIGQRPAHRFLLRNLGRRAVRHP
ncbi:hypothetical protein J2X76_000480 [Neorhizobium sp. 2083]|nr:hypothetical protein [Neorhizobium sp. 2083]